MSDSQRATDLGRDEHSTWYRRAERFFVLAPWVLLVPSAVGSLVRTELTWTDRAVTLGLVALAGGWIFCWHTMASEERRTRTGPMAVYFVGLVAISGVLMDRDIAFLLFAITGFLHAHYLRPWSVAAAGALLVSVVFNTIVMGVPEASPQSIGLYVGVILIQATAIGAGMVWIDKTEEQHWERGEMVAKLEAALEENAGLHAQLITQAREAGVLDERQRITREIHDTLAQGLAGLVTQIQAAQRSINSAEQARPHLDRAVDLARDNLAEARRSVQALQPRELEDAQLPDALSGMARSWAEQSEVSLQIDVTGDQVPLSPAIEVTLFRVAKEALTNVAKHAKATRVGLTLSYSGDVVLLDVRDDGAGITPDRRHGFGLTSTTQRVRGVGGTMTVESTPGEGTAISTSVPAITVQAR